MASQIGRYDLYVPLDLSTDLVNSVRSYVQTYMSQLDASHDWNHILRVLGLAKRILSETKGGQNQQQLDETAIYLSALLHDVGDGKYIQPHEDPETQIANMLLERGASEALAEKVQTIARNVSYTNEVKNPIKLQAILAQHPELAIVQDADRLDAIGATGVGRAFTYRGAKAPRESMQGAVDLFEERLEKYEKMMKTATGKRLARERTERLKIFRSWWDEEKQICEGQS